jgi:hypothetical protein
MSWLEIAFALCLNLGQAWAMTAAMPRVSARANQGRRGSAEMRT